MGPTPIQRLPPSDPSHSLLPKSSEEKHVIVRQSTSQPRVVIKGLSDKSIAIVVDKKFINKKFNQLAEIKFSLWDKIRAAFGYRKWAVICTKDEKTKEVGYLKININSLKTVVSPEKAEEIKQILSQAKANKLVELTDILLSQKNVPGQSPTPSAPPDETLIPPDRSSIPPDETLIPPDRSSIPPDETLIPPDRSSIPPDETLIPPDRSSIPPDEPQKPLPPPADLLGQAVDVQKPIGRKINVKDDGSCMFYAFAIALKGHPATKDSEILKGAAWAQVPTDPADPKQFKGDASKEETEKLTLAAEELRKMSADWLLKHQFEEEVQSYLETAANDYIAIQPDKFVDSRIPPLQRQLETAKKEMIKVYGKTYIEKMEKQIALQKKLEELETALKEEPLIAMQYDQLFPIERENQLKSEIEKTDNEIILLKKETDAIRSEAHAQGKTEFDDYQEASGNISIVEREIKTIRIEKYLNQCPDPDFYSGLPQILALSKIFNVRIDVYYEKENLTVSINEEAPGEPITLAIIGAQQNHFNLMVPGAQENS